MQKISLIEFSVENWGIFKDRVSFSMSARKKDGHTFESNGENLLKSSLIYGPNASGKTSLLNAYRDFRRVILTSANTHEGFEGSFSLPHKPFLGVSGFELKPTFYESVFSLESSDENNGVYKYNFSVLGNKIVEENLIEIQESGKERELISRNSNGTRVDKKFSDIFDFFEKHNHIKDTALFISVASQLSDKFTSEISEGFRFTNAITAISEDGYKKFTLDKFNENSEFHEKVINYLKQADFCIQEGDARDEDFSDASGKIKRMMNIFFKHPVFNNETEQINSFEIPMNRESDGTRRFFHILGPVIDTLEQGKLLWIDEFDNSLHPILTRFIVDLFDSEEVNTKHAQLIATTHDTSLLAHKRMIKDQFWFTEKDIHGAAKLFSLAEFELRNDSEYSKKYLEGRFGALPIVGVINE